MWLQRNYKKNPAIGEKLTQMVEAARAGAPDERLGDAARSRILGEALRADVAQTSLPRLFTPARRLIVTGALPVVLGVALLTGLDAPVQAPQPLVTTEVPRVVVSKQGDSVRFHVNNGGQSHRITRSTQPDRFDGSAGIDVSGGFEERLVDQADLVFYRID